MAVAFLSTSKAGIGKEAQAAAKVVTPVNGGLLSEAAASQAMRSLRPPTPSSRFVVEESQPDQPQYAPSGYNSINQFSQKIELYSGSVATVYQAVETKTGNRVVIKAYHKEKMQPKHHHKLQREIEAMVALNGSFVVELHSTFSDPANIYLVMEYCEGGDLFKTMMKHGGRLDEHYVCVEIIVPLLRVLEKMHALSVMHRDIKPENIFLTRRGRLRLGDFGLAMNWTKELPFSRSGTLDYMAPEVLQNPATQLQESPNVDMEALTAKNIKPFTCAVDVWAAGVLAYELVCGRPPFEVEDEVKTVTKILYCNNIRFPTPIPSGFSLHWSDFVRCALIKDPMRRPDAKGLLQHPWVQTNLLRAISCAPTPQHRQCKEDLLRPLSLVPRALRLPAYKPPALNMAASAAPTTISVAMPSTPQPKRVGQESTQQVVQYLHSHFSNMSCSDAGAGAGAAAAPPPPQQGPAPPQQLLSPPQRLQAAAPFNASPYNTSYQASPLSNRHALSYTPTKNHPSSLLGQAGANQARAAGTPTPPPHSSQAPAHAAQQPHGLGYLPTAWQSTHSSGGGSLSGGGGGGGRVEAGAAAHGTVHVTRSPSVQLPKAADSPFHTPTQTPTKAAAAAGGYAQESSRAPLLRSLFIPASASGPPPEELVHPSPGPAGPGIKERLKWHLSRQAGQ